MTESELNKAIAPVSYALNILAGKWNLKILAVLCSYNDIRYNELKRKVYGITGTMLNQSLKDLIENGIVQRVQYNEVPSRVEYSLTGAGLELIPIFEQLLLWGENQLEKSK
ncbi:winged helix-turn-helix transcriptional regulator [Bacillus sp. DWP3-1]|uniref:winged helix-turn-helix transcriptional regulator n=1 Tax=unclassified Bacillus (in: firmicutes) TaxID=185979 RepID=UPI003CF49F21